MIVDDSALVRQILQQILSMDPEIEVMGTAADPLFAAKKMAKEKPDVITLDLEMPRMNGLTFLKKVMTYNPVPVVIISSLTTRGAEATFRALEYGAIEVIGKPKVATRAFFEESRIRICDAVKAASIARIKSKKITSKDPFFTGISPLHAITKFNQSSVPLRETTDKLIIIGASTGGTHAIQTFLEGMPVDCPGTVIVQHMPELFTRSFAERLNAICPITVREGVHGESIATGTAIIAPGNKHLMIRKNGARYFIEINDDPLVNRHRPSVDVLFRSAARYAGPNAIGIIMTGMGDDGARGLLEMKQAGAYTIAQDEASSVVFGMPKVAIGLGAATAILPLDTIAEHVCGRLMK